ncbi:MAG: HK97-gp10 family putative phage morphogenesis protein, partial [Beijerinckiaceae bacterium]
GRIYQKYMPRRSHQASAPGEAPATDTGTLIAGIVIDRTDVKRGRIIIAATAPYAKALEYGTRKMAPRPFLRRALRAMRGRVVTIFREAVAR